MSTSSTNAACRALRFSVFIALLFLFHNTLHGQNETDVSRHALGYSLGFARIKEENLLPKVHSGVLHALNYEFQVQGNLSHSVIVQLAYGTVSTDITRDEGAFNARLLVSYSPQFVVRRAGGMTYCMGPMIAYSSSLAEYQTWDEAHAYWGTALSLGMSNVMSLDIGSARDLTFRLDCSLLGITSRPDRFRLYANERWTFSNLVKIMNSGFQYGFTEGVFQLATTARYRTPLFSSKSLTLSCSFSYSRLNVDGGKPLREIVTSLEIGLWL
jgi:hypothetical protein